MGDEAKQISGGAHPDFPYGQWGRVRNLDNPAFSDCYVYRRKNPDYRPQPTKAELLAKAHAAFSASSARYLAAALDKLDAFIGHAYSSNRLGSGQQNVLRAYADALDAYNAATK